MSSVFLNFLSLFSTRSGPPTSVRSKSQPTKATAALPYETRKDPAGSAHRQGQTRSSLSSAASLSTVCVLFTRFQIHSPIESMGVGLQIQQKAAVNGKLMPFYSSSPYVLAPDHLDGQAVTSCRGCMSYGFDTFPVDQICAVTKLKDPRICALP